MIVWDLFDSFRYFYADEIIDLLIPALQQAYTSDLEEGRAEVPLSYLER